MNDQINSLRLSFEFFPPKTDAGREKLFTTRDELKKFSPEFFSMTYGAGGSTRDNTKGLVKQFLVDGVVTAPHLSFGGDTEESIAKLIAHVIDTDYFVARKDEAETLEVE